LPTDARDLALALEVPQARLRDSWTSTDAAP
jgi:hypothetical protein